MSFNPKSAALDSLKKKLQDIVGDRLGGLKKPVGASMTIEKLSPSDNEDEEKFESDDDASEPSDEDKAKIEELYMKYCRGGRV